MLEGPFEELLLINAKHSKNLNKMLFILKIYV